MKKIKCWVCGAEATKTRLLSNPAPKANGEVSTFVKPTKHRRCYCDKCYDQYLNNQQEQNKLWIELKKRRMFENAMDKLERQNIDFLEYEEAIKAVEEYNIQHADKFDSSSEIIAAIVLIKNRIHIKPQYKIGKYQVDFLLPERHIVLEIDGERHKYSKDKDNVRDVRIKQALGPQWNIIRIPGDCIDEAAKNLVKAIDGVEKYRKQQQLYWKTTL